MLSKSKRCFDLDFIANNYAFIKLEVLKNGMKFELGIALRESALYRLALAGHKKRITSKKKEEKTDF